MAITKSAKKAIRQNTRRREQNIVYKDKMKSLIKEARSLVLEKKSEDAKKMLSAIYSILDKAAKKGVIKKNAASRKKSRLTRLIEKKQK